MAAEEVVGGIVGFLRLDADQFHREITKAIAEVKVLKGMDAKVHVEATGVRSAERDLLKVGAAAKVVDRNVVGMNRSFAGGGGGGLMSPPVIIGGLTAAMALLGPVTGAAAAATAGFVGVLGTGILAFQGFKKEIEDGTARGRLLQGQLDSIKTEFADLGTTAALAMSGDVRSALGEVQRFLPTLNDDVDMLGGSLGRAFRVSTTGLISGLKNAMPLLQDGGHYAELLAQKFADFTNSQDFKDFVDYARRELPGVGQAIISLAGGVKDLAVSLAPAGDSLVTLINVAGKLASGLAWVLDGLQKIGDWTAAPEIGKGNWVSDLFGIGSSGEAEQATQAVEEHTKAVANLAAVQSPLASTLGTTDQAISDFGEKNRQAAATAADATLQMQLQGDAAGLLKQQLDILNGKQIDVASAETNSAAATLGAVEALKSHTKGLKDYGSRLDLNTKIGTDARKAIERKVLADQAQAEAIANATGKTADGTKSLKDNKAALEATLKKQGVLTDKVQAYIDKLYAIPKKVPPTKLEVQTAAGLAGIRAFQKAIDALHGKAVTASVHYAYTGRLPNGGLSTAGGQTFADGGTVWSKIPGYAGGTIIGPGTGRSDSILAGIAGTQEAIRVSNGEFISTDASRRRNAAALEAGNKGATLGVVGGAASGKVELGDSSLYRLAAILTSKPLTAQVSAHSLDSAMGRMLL